MTVLSLNGDTMKPSTLVWQENKESDGPKTSEKEASFAGFAANATIHGLRNTVDPAFGNARRALWVLLLVTFAGYLIVVIAYRVQKYSSYPVSSKMQMVEVDSIALPALTICNMNLIRKSYVEKDEFVENVFLYLNTLTRDQSNISLEDTEVQERVDADYGLRKTFREGGYKLQDLIYACSWNGSEVECSDYFTIVLTPMGNCFTLQSLAVIEKKGRLIASQTGVDQGFSIYVNISQDDYFYQTSYSAGLRVLVHDPHDWPLIESLGMAISPGTETFLSVSELRVKRMPPPYGDNTCVDVNDPNFQNPLKYFDEYTKSACIRDCLVDYLISSCKCVPHTVTIKNSSVPDCRCLQYGECIMLNEYIYKTNSKHLRKCNCRDTCSKNSYQVTRSEAYYPSERRSYEIGALSGHPEDYETSLRQNLLIITMYMSEMNYNLYEETAAYSLGDFQSDVGGNLGLCLGASFLSLVEPIEFFFFGILGLACNFSKVKPISRSMAN